MIRPGRIIKKNHKFSPVLIFIILSSFIGILILNTRISSNKNQSGFLYKFIEEINKRSDIIPNNHSSRMFYLLVNFLKDLDYIRCDNFLPDPKCFNKIQTQIIKEENFRYNKKNGLFLDSDFKPYHNLKSLIITFPESDIEKKSHNAVISEFTGENNTLVLYNLLHLVNKKCNNLLFNKWILVENDKLHRIYEKKFTYIISNNSQSLSVGFQYKPSRDIQNRIALFLKLLEQQDGYNRIIQEGLWCY